MVRHSIGRNGDAWTLCVWRSGIEHYGVFCTLSGLHAWLVDHCAELDCENSYYLDLEAA